MVIIETTIFTKLITTLMSDDNYRELQEFLIAQPDKGDLIKNSGGLRKVRWKTARKGQRGGVRIIYYWVVSEDELRMLYVYPKSKQDNLTDEQLKILKHIVEGWHDG